MCWYLQKAPTSNSAVGNPLMCLLIAILFGYIIYNGVMGIANILLFLQLLKEVLLSVWTAFFRLALMDSICAWSLSVWETTWT
ncbi:hypothetical protein Droror1_Dr00014565 [Drosera rotundifolia]